MAAPRVAGIFAAIGSSIATQEKNGIFTSEIHQWGLVPWENHLKKR